MARGCIHNYNNDDYYNNHDNDDYYYNDNLYYHNYNEHYDGYNLNHDTLIMALDGPVIFGKDVARLDGTHYLVVGTASTLYLLNPSTLAASVIESGFNTDTADRWQSAYINGNLILTNNEDAPRVYSGGTSIAVLGDDGDRPDKARFCVNITGHLVFLNVVEGASSFPQRMRWSDINQPAVWVPTDDNEANFIDFDETPDLITGAALLGPQQLVVYKEFNIYTATYSGRPTIFDIRRIVTDEGLFAPYSLVAFRDSHFFLGNNDFYRFDGSQLAPLGVNRVRDTLFDRMRKQNPDTIYGFAHPLFPEIWWVYKLQGSDTFNSALVYNYEQDVWTTRENFPHSMLTEYFDSSTITFDQVTNLFSEASLTFSQKKTGGTFSVYSGDANGLIHEHGRIATAAGADLVSTIETGDLVKGNTPTYMNRANIALTKVGSQDLTVDILYRKQFDEPMSVWTSVLYDGTPQIDFRATAKFFGLRISTASQIALAGYTIVTKPAGERV